MDDAAWRKMLIDGLDGWFDGEVEPFADDYVSIEGTYRIVTSKLTTDQDAALLEIYKVLPGHYQINAAEGMPYWYGENQNDVPYLTASFEPGGILIEGILQRADWVEWDAMFRRLVDQVCLPRYPA
jgi:hypothetical protein